MFWTENLKYMCKTISISSIISTNAQTQGGNLFTVPKKLQFSINTDFFIGYCEAENYSKIHLKQKSFKIPDVHVYGRAMLLHKHMLLDSRVTSRVKYFGIAKSIK